MNKYFLFSDTHGCFDALVSSLDAAGFDIDNPKHYLIGAGDYFDRGDRNGQIYNFLSSEQLQNRAYLVKGNHDEMLENFLIGSDDGFFNSVYNGLDKSIGNFAQIKFNLAMLQYEPDFYRDKINLHYPKLRSFLKSMKKGFQLDNYIIVHAGFTDRNSLKDWLEPNWVVDNWTKTPIFVKNFPDKENIYIFGHWHARKLRKEFGYEESDKIFKHENFIGLDSRTNLSDFVNVFVIESESLPKILEY